MKHLIYFLHLPASFPLSDLHVQMYSENGGNYLFQRKSYWDALDTQIYSKQ
jgi:hypothetical protein